MTALRATWLTWKLHRFEVLVSAVLMAAVATSAGIVALHLRSLDIPTGCWDWPGGAYPNEMCQRLVNAWFDILGNEGGHVRFGLLVVPTLVGLMLGATLVGRELELRTASLAWSLEGGRMRWLAQRLGGIALLVVLGLTAMAVMGSAFESATHVPGDTDRIGELAKGGAPLLSRGLAALGIALLAGAVLGRTVPALLVATVAVGALWYVGSGIVPKLVAPAYAVWIDDTQRRHGDFVHVVEYAEIDTSPQGLTIVCGLAPAPGEEDPDYEACYNVYDPSMVYGRWLAVPASALPVIEGAQVGIDLLALGGGVGLTALVVRRRRPD